MVAKLVSRFPAFMEPECSLPYSQEPADGHYSMSSTYSDILEACILIHPEMYDSCLCFT
jgi:hypothetical protein